MSDSAFLTIMFSFGALMALCTLVYVIKHAFGRSSGEIGGWELRGARQRITAVMRTTIAEGLRANVASGFALMILISIPLFWATAEGDGTIKGRVQMFISSSMGFAGFLLAILTILFSCRSLSTEISSRQIYGIVSKPVPRWQIIAGKWCGVMLVNTALLFLAAVMTYAGTHLTVERFKTHLKSDLEAYGNLTPDQAETSVAALSQVKGVGKSGMESPLITTFAERLGKTREEVGDMLLRLPEATRVDLRRFDELRRRVLVARHVISAPVPDFSEEIEAIYQKLKEEDRLPHDWTVDRIRRPIEAELVGAFCAIPYGEGRLWTLKGPPPEEGLGWVMSLRFKIRAPRQPLATKVGAVTLEEDKLYCLWGLGDPGKTKFLSTEDQYPINVFDEIEIPQQGVEEDGRVLVSFQNIDPRKIEAIFDLPHDGLQSLYRVGPWELGLLQVVLAMLIPLSCLAAFGVCASTFLSFPVGALIVLTLYLISSSMGFLADSLAVTAEYAPPVEQRTLAYETRRLTVAALDWALSIGDLDPVNKLMEGRSVGWGSLGDAAWKYFLLKGAAVMFIAVLTFRRRELAAVIV